MFFSYLQCIKWIIIHQENSVQLMEMCESEERHGSVLWCLHNVNYIKHIRKEQVFIRTFIIGFHHVYPSVQNVPTLKTTHREDIFKTKAKTLRI